jgi:hypothetical protein
MRFAVESLILTGATVSLVSLCGLIYVFPGYSLDSAFSETFRKHPGPVLVPLVFDFLGGRHSHDVLVVSCLS